MRWKTWCIWWWTVPGDRSHLCAMRRERKGSCVPWLSLGIWLWAVVVACQPPAPPEPIGAAEPDTLQQTPPVIDGLHEIRRPDGSVQMSGPMRNGQRDGDWTAYFPDGTVQSRGVFKNGLRHGRAEVFHPDGRPYYTGQYTHDAPSGEWLFYDSTGQLQRTVIYDTLGNILDRR